MTPITASRPNVYTGSPIDRVSDRRDDAAWVAAALAAPDAWFVPVWRARSFVRGLEDGQPEAVLLSAADAPALARLAATAANATTQDATTQDATTQDWALLGLLDGRPVFAIDLGAAEAPAVALPEALGGFADLRRIGPGMPGEQAAILAHARGLLHWRARHRFCGVCGQPCVPRSAGNAMACTGCEAQHFPRTDPAVIMLVTHGGRALLGHSTRFPRKNMYSTLAGFVEPGESLEEAVRREVFEEAGVRVGYVAYHSSQPWPFPASIMLGFYAEALTEEIVIATDELRDARWFTRAEVRDPDAHGFTVPPPDSIARRLIDDWVSAGG
jgi:NAD+ diphosphatase